MAQTDFSRPSQTVTVPLLQHNQFGITTDCHYNEQITWGHMATDKYYHELST